ncbi:MAG: hypothetical protein IPF54_05455 [Draconibacterium sp.]|nr:hypothetical protein [Draconibacterium sp.]
MGSKRKELVTQYLVESPLMTGISAILALLIVVLLLPQFNELAAKEMKLGFEPEYLLIFSSIFLITGLLAGSYPAFYLSGLKTISTLQGTQHLFGSISRRGLVIFQFVLSTVLILSVFIVYKQLEYTQNKNLGYDKDNLVYFDINGKIRQNLDAFLSALEQLDGIKSASSIQPI